MSSTLSQNTHRNTKIQAMNGYKKPKHYVKWNGCIEEQGRSDWGRVCACVFILTCSVVLVQRISLSAERQTHPAAESSLLPSHLLSLQTSRSGYAHTHTQFYVNTHFSWCAILSLCPWKWLTINCYQLTASNTHAHFHILYKTFELVDIVWSVYTFS